MATKYIVNNVTGQTIDGNSIPRPYNVFSGIVTQNGGDVLDTQSSGSLTIGRSYEITNYQTGDDFTNAGAPSNENGVKFIATTTEPSVWTNNSELSFNLGAPEVFVLENTLGNVYFLYDTVGTYVVNLQDGFTENKTFFSYNTTTSDDGGVSIYDIFIINTSVSTSSIKTFNMETATNSLLTVGGPLFLEIRVYD